jgi:membrane-associated phospholipid phosphatase
LSIVLFSGVFFKQVERLDSFFTKKQIFMIFKAYFSIALITTVFSFKPALAQNDTNRVPLQKRQTLGMGKYDYGGRVWYKRNPYKALIAPAALIGLGAIMLNNPVYDKRDFHTDLFNLFPNFRGTTIDNFLIFSPYVELVALNLVQIKCENDFLNTSLLIVKSEIIDLALTYGLKYITHEQRPNNHDDLSFPSGHTSQAFVAAALINREYRYKHKWVGISAYGLATSVAIFRMLNNKHWISDVLAGAGIGILSANLAYITHKWKWGRPGTCLVPTMQFGKPGVFFAHRF